MEERRTTDDVFSLLGDCRISSSQESLLDDAPWSEPPLPTTADSVAMLSPPETQGGGPHEAQSSSRTTPEVIDILSSPESQGDPHQAHTPPPSTADVIIILSSPESQYDDHQLQPEDDIDVSQCMVNRAVIDVEDEDEESDSSDEARELMAPLFSGLGFEREIVTESSHAAEFRNLDEELEVSERGVNKKMKFSDNNEGVETNFGANLQSQQNDRDVGGGGEASDVVETVETTDNENCQASRSNAPGRRVLPSSFSEKPRKERRFPSAFDVLKALAENDKDDLSGMDLVEAAKRM